MTEQEFDELEKQYKQPTPQNAVPQSVTPQIQQPTVQQNVTIQDEYDNNGIELYKPKQEYTYPTEAQRKWREEQEAIDHAEFKKLFPNEGIRGNKKYFDWEKQRDEELGRTTQPNYKARITKEDVNDMAFKSMGLKTSSQRETLKKIEDANQKLADFTQVFGRNADLVKMVTDKKEYTKRMDELDKNIVESMRSVGIDVRKSKKDGQLYVFIDDKPHLLNSSTWQSIKDGLDANALTLLGDIVGGIAGAKVGSKAPANFKIPATILGGIAGSTAGGSIGSLFDTFRNSLEIKDRVSSGDYLDKAVDEGVTSMAFGSAVPVLGTLLKGAGKVGKTGINSTVEFISKLFGGGVESKASKIGYSIDEAKKVNKAVGKYETQPLFGGTSLKLANQARGKSNMANVVEGFLRRDPEKAVKFANTVSTRDTRLLDALRSGASPEELKAYADGIRQRADDFFQTTIADLSNNYPNLQFSLMRSQAVRELDNQGVLQGTIAGERNLRTIFENMADLAVGGRLSFEQVSGARSLISNILNEEPTGVKKNVLKKVLDGFDDDISRMLQPDDLSRYREAVEQFRNSREANAFLDSLSSIAATQDTVASSVNRNMKSINNNLQNFISKLPPNEQGRAEVGFIYSIVEKAAQGFTSGRTSINYDKVIRDMNGLRFTTESGQRTQRIVDEMGRLFRADNQLMKVAEEATFSSASVNIATTPSGKIQQATAGWVYRNLRPLIPILGDDARLQKQILDGLTKSSSIKDFIRLTDNNINIPDNVKRELKYIFVPQLIEGTANTLTTDR
jgi:uncharacterized protein YaaR (DUF327 family)